MSLFTTASAGELLPTKAPDIEAEHGKAWRYDYDAMFSKPGTPKGMRELNVCGWLVYAPWAHPIWHSYCIMCISLRKLDGWPAAHINLPGATHEIFVAALDPAPKSGPYKLDETAPMLRPLNFSSQFICVDDAAAAASILSTVQGVVRGHINPDTDARSQWVAMYGSNGLRR